MVDDTVTLRIENARLTRELAEAKALIKTGITTAKAGFKRSFTVNLSDMADRLRDENAKLIRERDDARAVSRAGPNVEEAMGRREREIIRLNDKLAATEAKAASDIAVLKTEVEALKVKLADAPGAVAKAERQLFIANSRVRVLEEQVKRREFTIRKSAHNRITKALHPDSDPAASTERRATLTAAFTDWREIKFNVVG